MIKPDLEIVAAARIREVVGKLEERQIREGRSKAAGANGEESGNGDLSQGTAGKERKRGVDLAQIERAAVDIRAVVAESQRSSRRLLNTCVSSAVRY